MNLGSPVTKIQNIKVKTKDDDDDHLFEQKKLECLILGSQNGNLAQLIPIQ